MPITKSLLKHGLIFFLFLIRQTCLAQEVYDVETIPTQRSKTYEKGNYKKIVVFSAPRTGSSVVYNIFRFLFEDESKLFEHHHHFDLDRVVLRTHKFSEMDLIESTDTLFIIVYRDPFAASVSNYRICMRKSINNKMFAQELVQKHCKYLLFSEDLENKGRSLIRLRYEDFADHLDSIFDVIEAHMHLTIDSQDRDLMKKSYSKDNIYACTNHLKDFSEYLPISGFHGGHVNLQEYTPPKDFLYWLTTYVQQAIPFFQTYGYFLDASN